MTDSTILEFVNKHCKQDRHHDCAGKWIGFGFEVICMCKCGHSEKGPALERLSGLRSNESLSHIQQVRANSQEGSQEYDS